MVYKPIKFEMSTGGAIAGGMQSSIGMAQVIASYLALQKLQRTPIDQYKETAELKKSRLRAEDLAKYGFTPEQKATFFQNLATLNNQRFKRGTEAGGGNTAQAVLSGVQYGNINALNNFSSQDADRKMRNIQYADSFASRLQQLKNMQTQMNIQQRMEKERALGAGIQAGVTNIYGGASTFAGGANGTAGKDTTGQVPVSWQNQANSDYFSGYDNPDSVG